MDAKEVDSAIHELKFVAGVNQRYHQCLAFRWGLADKAIKVAVGLVAVWSTYLSTAGPTCAGWATAAGWISLAIAVALNVIPTGDYVRDHTDLFRRWSDLFKSAQMIQTRFTIEALEKATPEIRSRIAEAKECEQALHATQVAPFKGLFKQCEADELFALYGVSTYEEAHAKQWFIPPPVAVAPVAAVAAAVAAGPETSEVGH